jgi:hypothetical protein
MKSVSVSRCSPVLEPAHRKPLSSETDFTPSVSELLAAFNLALDEHGLKRDALAAAACMSPGHFSKVTTDPRLAGFPRVLASMPDEAFLLFLARYAPASCARSRRWNSRRTFRTRFPSWFGSGAC